MRIRIAFFMVAMGLAGAVQAQDLESMNRAMELGTILASEEACDLTLSGAGLEAWIAANVADDDLSFASNLSLMSMGQEAQISDMSASSRIAHCATVRKTAGSMGLIE